MFKSEVVIEVEVDKRTVLKMDLWTYLQNPHPIQLGQLDNNFYRLAHGDAIAKVFLIGFGNRIEVLKPPDIEP